MDAPRPSAREDFEVGIVCALPREYDAVNHVFDRFWDDDGDTFGRVSEDANTYTTGRIGKHDVVLALLPHMGNVDAASAAAHFRVSYNRLRLVLLVGVCGAVPRTPSGDGRGGEDIFLGDVIISNRVVQYDFGRQLPGTFQTTTDTVEGALGKPDKNIRGLLSFFSTERGLDRLERRTGQTLKKIQDKLSGTRRAGKYEYPGARHDKLFRPTYAHKHHGEQRECVCRDAEQPSDPVCQAATATDCGTIGCEDEHLDRQRPEERPGGDGPAPAIYVGTVGSAGSLVRSSEHRDRISERTGALAVEMEGAGLWEQVPTIIVKGVCDYADCHKHKLWQDYAAATAASAASAVLGVYPRSDRAGQTGAAAEEERQDTWQQPGPRSTIGSINGHNVIQGNQFTGSTSNFTFH